MTDYSEAWQAECEQLRLTLAIEKRAYWKVRERERVLRAVLAALATGYLGGPHHD